VLEEAPPTYRHWIVFKAYHTGHWFFSACEQGERRVARWSSNTGNWTLVSLCSRLASVLQVTKYHDFIECYSLLRLKKLNTIFAERARRGGRLAISSAESPVDMLCSWLCLRIQNHISLFNTETILVHSPHFKKYKIVLKLMRENIYSGFTQKLRNKLPRVFHDF